MNNLKSYRENELKWYVLAYVFLVILVCYPNAVKDLEGDWATKLEQLLSSALLSGIICTLTFVFNSIFSSQAKDFLLYFHIFKTPGSTIFSRIQQDSLHDPRVNTSNARFHYQEIIANIPTSKKKEPYENSKWYAIYSKHRADDRVAATHRDFLLCRDLYITTVSLAVLTLAMISISLLPFSWILIGYLLIMLFVTNLSARNKAHRFVNTVIAVDLASVQT